ADGSGEGLAEAAGDGLGDCAKALDKPLDKPLDSPNERTAAGIRTARVRRKRRGRFILVVSKSHYPRRALVQGHIGHLRRPRVPVRAKRAVLTCEGRFRPMTDAPCRMNAK
ncbi:hypothetical protein, partial [Bradyrhizobium sp.]|uniref:hypothetical protein n=1 Tax=Bradyrhizobium sp. TaxID=376 RepID=UPI00239DFCC9